MPKRRAPTGVRTAAQKAAQLRAAKASANKRRKGRIEAKQAEHVAYADHPVNANSSRVINHSSKRLNQLEKAKTQKPRGKARPGVPSKTGDGVAKPTGQHAFSAPQKYTRGENARNNRLGMDRTQPATAKDRRAVRSRNRVHADPATKFRRAQAVRKRRAAKKGK